MFQITVTLSMLLPSEEEIGPTLPGRNRLPLLRRKERASRLRVPMYCDAKRESTYMGSQVPVCET